MRAAYAGCLLAAVVSTAVLAAGPVTYIPGRLVDEGFAKGAVLVNAGGYMIHASRREADGLVEIHEADTDIIHVLEGTADLVTGGTIVDAKVIAPEEIRGASVRGGETRALSRGDVIVVPNGTPHWFRNVRGPLLYYVVKVRDPRVGATPAAEIDLGTEEGLTLAQSTWRYKDARVVEVPFRSVGDDLKPTGPPNVTQDIDLHAGDASFDDASWSPVPPGGLAARKTNGRLSFGWYRLTLTVPERVGSFETVGSDVVFAVTVDDYAEVWVNGRLQRMLGQRGGSLVAGWNAPNRVVVARDARPGQRIQIALFAANGPLSDPPPNYVWIRSARVQFYKGEPLTDAGEPAGPRAAGGFVETRITRADPALDAIVSAGARIEKLAEGFQFTEGPVWRAPGELLFSDPNANRIYRWTPDRKLSVFRDYSGYEGLDIAEYKQPGSNGLAIDPLGRLSINQHGNRRVVRLEEDGHLTPLTDRYDGKRLNSPNDLVYRSDGALYFTDPPFGLPRFGDDPRKELPFSGVFRVKDGKTELLARDLAGPNGLAFSPDERFLYVDNWDEKQKIVMRYPVKADGTLGAGQVFFDMTNAPGEEALDGLKVDGLGNLYVSGPGGVWILSPEGKHLGTISGPELPANFAWGDEDGRTLYLTARTGLYRIRLKIPGARTGQGGVSLF